MTATQTQPTVTTARPQPRDALTDALDRVGRRITDAQCDIPRIGDDDARSALENLADAVQYLRLAASILGAEVGEISEVVQ